MINEIRGQFRIKTIYIKIKALDNKGCLFFFIFDFFPLALSGLGLVSEATYKLQEKPKLKN